MHILSPDQVLSAVIANIINGIILACHTPLIQQLLHQDTCFTLHCQDAQLDFIANAHLQPLQARLIAHYTMQATHDIDMQLGSEHRVWGYRILVGLLMLFMVLLYAGIWAYMQYYT